MVAGPRQAPHGTYSASGLLHGANTEGPHAVAMDFAAVESSTETLPVKHGSKRGLNEHETLLKLLNKYHRAPSLLKVVPVLAASYCSDALRHQELEFNSVGNFPCVRTDSPAGINKSRGGGH